MLPGGLLRYLTKYPTQIPYRLEWSIVHRTPKGYLIYGQPDGVFLDTATMQLIVVDFKNVGKFLAPSSSIGTHPRTWRLYATKPNQYTMQVQVYMSILEADYALPYPISHGVILNFDPEDPDGFEEYRVEKCDYTQPGGVFSDFPWDDAAPEHRAFDIKIPANLPMVPMDDPRAAGPTRCGVYVGHVVNGPDDPLPPGIVWTGAAYEKGKYRLSASPFAPTRRLFNKGTWAVAADYEEYLLAEEQRDLLVRAGKELFGCILVCWCWPTGSCKCHASVLCRWANLLGGGHVQLPPTPNDIRTFFDTTTHGEV